MNGRITVMEGNLVEQKVDAVVNAANSALILGAGVAGAIRTAGGPEIQRECDELGPIEVGDAAISGAGNLPARYVVHAATMPPGGSASPQSIESSMRAVLKVARTAGVRTLAIPALGTGVGGVPLERCAKVLLGVARECQSGTDPFGEIRFVLFGEPSYRVFEMVLDAAKVAAQMERFKGKTGE